MNKRTKKILTTVIPVFLLLVGLSVMLYPVISDWWNSKVQTRAISNYDTAVAEMDRSQTEEFLRKAHEYNKRLDSLPMPFTDYSKIDGYEETLDISGTGIMGYITIPAINSELVIYHSTSDEVLNIAAGHLQGTSLPVGGTGTHSVISAHRGLPSAKLFSELDKLVIGDTFTITILDEILTYQVEKIFIVEPDQIDKLLTVEGKDYVTLMTCTPYGINTHRLLIRSKRIDTVYKTNINVTADASAVDSMLIVPFIALPLFGGLIVVWTVKGKTKKRRKIDYSELIKGGDS
ncbi:MAG: class C sortase [Oscillospiraceae bacterium]|nr:class C sortase [Oscillospiraceae bacterium]